MLTRRSLLGAGVAGVGVLASGCGEDEEVPVTSERIDYGSDPSQWVELTRPTGESRGIVVVIHGGKLVAVRVPAMKPTKQVMDDYAHPAVRSRW